MHQTERLQQREVRRTSHSEIESPPATITREEVNAIYQQRRTLLKQVRTVVCPNFYETICEKIEQEKKLFERLLHWEDAKQDALSRYTFILNPLYFEQRFLGEE